MVTFTIARNALILDVQGLDRLWTFTSRLEIPLENIRRVYADPAITRGWWKGLKAPGTHVPGVIVAGTFYQDGKRIFWDVKDPEHAIVLELVDDRYDQLIVEVDQPAVVVARLTAEIG